MGTAEIHQIEGFDPKKRSFNRNVFLIKREKGYVAQLTYEGLYFETPLFPIPSEAIYDLIKTLQNSNFTQLRTKLNFKGKTYLTEVEPWINY